MFKTRKQCVRIKVGVSLLAVGAVVGCAARSSVEPKSANAELMQPAMTDWAAVQKLKVNTRVRVLTKDMTDANGAWAHYGRVMNSSQSFLTLELSDRSKRLQRDEIVRIDREATNVGRALPRSATSFGLALATASNGTPESYDMSVGPGKTKLIDPQPNNISGYHIDALALARQGIGGILRAWNTSNDWVSVYDTSP